MHKKPILFGFIGSIALLLIYFLILTIANSYSHAVQQFFEMWYWIVLLVGGFGIQIGLFVYSKNYAKLMSSTSATSAVAVSGGTSTTAMVACCAHHVSDVLPIIGLGAAALFLVKYQLFFILIGVFSNIIGINFMLSIIQKHGLFHRDGLLSKIMKLDLKKYLKYNIAFTVIILIIFLINII